MVANCIVKKVITMLQNFREVDCCKNGKKAYSLMIMDEMVCTQHHAISGLTARVLSSTISTGAAGLKPFQFFSAIRFPLEFRLFGGKQCCVQDRGRFLYRYMASSRKIFPLPLSWTLYAVKRNWQNAGESQRR